jgi:hypothetical protein
MGGAEFCAIAGKGTNSNAANKNLIIIFPFFANLRLSQRAQKSSRYVNGLGMNQIAWLLLGS